MPRLIEGIDCFENRNIGQGFRVDADEKRVLNPDDGGLAESGGKKPVQAIDPPGMRRSRGGHFDDFSTDQFKPDVIRENAEVTHPMKLIDREKLLGNGLCWHFLNHTLEYLSGLLQVFGQNAFLVIPVTYGSGSRLIARKRDFFVVLFPTLFGATVRWQSECLDVRANVQRPGRVFDLHNRVFAG